MEKEKKKKSKIKDFLNGLKKKTNSFYDLETLKVLDEVAYISTPDVREEFYYLNEGVGTCIVIYRFPTTISQKIMNAFKGHQDIMVTIDMEHLENRKLLEFLDKKIDSMENERQIATKTTDSRDVDNKVQSEKEFTDYMNKSYENGKYCTLRIYVTARNLEELNITVDWVHSLMKARQLFGSVQRNMMDNELRSLSSFNNPVKEIVSTKGVVNMIMSDNIAEVKPNMIPIGDTQTGLPYCPDFFSYSYRSYCLAIMGLQGSGKSSLIKSIIQSALMRKEQVIILDVHNGEYKNIAERYHVPSVALDMNNGINCFQIFNNDLSKNVITSMVVADAVMLNRRIFMSVTGETNTTIISMYISLLTRMYKDYLGVSVDEIKNSEWFCGRDIQERFLKDVEEGIEYKNAPKEFLFKLNEHLKVLINTYGYFFDTHTTMNIDINHSIRFDLSSMNIESGGQLENAYFGLIFSFLGKMLRENERLNERLEYGKKVLRPKHPLTIVTEETGTVLKNAETCRMIDVFMRQTRKSRASFVFALHTMKDIIGGDEERKKLIESIFSLCSTYIIGQIDIDTAESIPKFVSGISESDAKSAVNFIVEPDDKEKRRKFLAYTVDDKKRIIFYSKVLPRQQALFGGGK